jgi:hypothetical protein
MTPRPAQMRPAPAAALTDANACLPCPCLQASSGAQTQVSSRSGSSCLVTHCDKSQLLDDMTALLAVFMIIMLCCMLAQWQPAALGVFVLGQLCVSMLQKSRGAGPHAAADTCLPLNCSARQ